MCPGNKGTEVDGGGSLRAAMPLEKNGGTTARSGGRPAFLLLPMIEALERFAGDPSTAHRAAVGDAFRTLGSELGLLTSTAVRVAAPPLPELELRLPGGGTAGQEIVLRASGIRQPVGSIRVSGDRAEAAALARGVEVAIVAVRARAQAGRAARQRTALDQAVRGISGILDVERVLQLITDRVQDLVEAQYAAIGIVDADGAIERFITSGISDEGRRRIGDLPHGRGLLGLIIRENRTYRIADIGPHPERFGFPEHHPEMHSFLGMPITAGGETVGRLYLTNKVGAAEFSAEDEALVEMFALHAGIAISSARLHDQVRRLAIVDERDRISRDLHDSVIQSIYAQTLALDDVPDLISEDADEARRRVDEAIDALHAVIRDIRNFIFGLRRAPRGRDPDRWDSLPGDRASSQRRGRGRVAVSDRRNIVADLPIELVAELLAVTREALSNIARHASATQAGVRLVARAPATSAWRSPTMAAASRSTQAAARGHHGIGNIRARIAALGGTFACGPSPGEGTAIMVRAPHRRDRAEEGMP